MRSLEQIAYIKIEPTAKLNKTIENVDIISKNATEENTPSEEGFPSNPNEESTDLELNKTNEKEAEILTNKTLNNLEKPIDSLNVEKLAEITFNEITEHTLKPMECTSENVNDEKVEEITEEIQKPVDCAFDNLAGEKVTEIEVNEDSLKSSDNSLEVAETSPNKIKKDVTKIDSADSKIENTEASMETTDTNDNDEDIPIPPAKGYNLDFLDSLDDPNFNPFATKTNVVDDINPDSAEKKILTPVAKKSANKKVKNPPVAELIPENKTIDVVETVESVAQQPDMEKTENDNLAATEQSSDVAEKTENDNLVETTENNLTESNPQVETENTTTEGLTNVLEKESVDEQKDNIDLIPIGPKEKPMAIVKPHLEKVPPMSPIETEKSADFDKPFATGSKEVSNIDKEMETVVDSMPTEEEDIIVPPAKGYNLDFLDKLDDPNFNPFETKTAIQVHFDNPII